MAIRGRTRNVAVKPLLALDGDDHDIIIPANYRLENGTLTDFGNWRKRPGLVEVYDLGVNEQVTSLFRDTGKQTYATTDTGKLFILKSDMTSAVLGDTFVANSRPQWANKDETVFMASGGPLKFMNGSKLNNALGSPPMAKYIGVMGDYVLLSGFDRTEFRWSDPVSTTLFPGSNFSNVQDYGGEIRNMFVLREKLYFFQDRTIEVWAFGTGSAEFVRQSIIARGTLAGDSVVSANNTLYWLGNDGEFYGLQGITPKPISLTISQTLRDIARKDDCLGFDFTKEHVIRWFFPATGRCLVYNYEKNFFSEDVSGSAECRMPINTYVHFEETLKTYVGDYYRSGKIFEWTVDALDDDGDEIAVRRHFTVPLSESGNQARVNRILLRLTRNEEGNATDGLITMRIGFDRAPKQTYTYDLGQIGESHPYVSEENLGVGREMSVEIIETDARKLLLSAIMVTARDLGN